MLLQKPTSLKKIAYCHKLALNFGHNAYGVSVLAGKVYAENRNRRKKGMPEPEIATGEFVFSLMESGMDRFSRNNYSNAAHLKELMTAPPMTAEQHAAINRKRNEQRRMIEEARESRNENTDSLY